MEQATTFVTRRQLHLWLTAVLVLAAAIGWLAGSAARPQTPLLDMLQVENGRLAQGGGWFVRVNFDADDISGGVLTLEVTEHLVGKHRIQAIPVDPDAKEAYMELRDPVQLPDGKWDIHSGWLPGPASVRLTIRGSGKRLAHASDPWPIELDPGTGHPGAFPIPMKQKENG